MAEKEQPKAMPGNKESSKKAVVHRGEPFTPPKSLVSWSTR